MVAVITHRTCNACVIRAMRKKQEQLTQRVWVSLMSNPWFRMYAEFAHDPKVQMLSEAMQRRYVMIMCMRCSNVLVTLHETEIAFHLRVTEIELAETKALFVAKGFIDSAWNLLNWEKRQFASDTSKARVAKHRALQKAKQSESGNADVTLQKQNDNGLDTDTDTDNREAKPRKRVVVQAIAKPEDVEDQTWEDWKKLRKDKRASVSSTVLGEARLESAKAGMTLQRFLTVWCLRGSQGMQADWLKPNERAAVSDQRNSQITAGAI